MTPQTTLEFRVWSHHTLKADALLGRATIDLKQALLIHNRKCKFFVLVFVSLKVYFRHFENILKSKSKKKFCIYKGGLHLLPMIAFMFIALYEIGNIYPGISLSNKFIQNNPSHP